MSKTIMRCSLCQKQIVVKGSFWFDRETTAIGNVMLLPHFIKHHRKEIAPAKLVGVLRSFLFLLLFVPIHVVFFLMYYSFFPFYWLLEKLYG